MSNIEDIKARIDIVDLVSETVKLRKSGKNYVGYCPFHDNKRTPAFAVFQDSGTWKCFGQCSEGGDIFKFVMKKEGWDFSEALRYLADRAGVQLRAPTPEEDARDEQHDRLRQLLEESVTFYRHHLKSTPAGKQALAYLYKRGLDDKTIDSWGLGYAPQSWDLTLNYLKAKGYNETELIDAGMVSQRDSGGVYDRFRHRVTFPIRDERGLMTGFGARILDPDDIPKFLNSPQTALFDKGNLLYGLDKASRSIRTEDQAVIVEGYLDVIATHMHGFTNVVAPMGTALTEHQMRMLKRRTRRIVLALDADAAGMKATMRGLEIARETMDREAEVAFDARGLLRHEARMQADIRVTTLPDEKDPDDVVNDDPELWARLVAEAKPVVIHVMETLAASQNLDDPKIKSAIAKQVMPLIEDVPDAIERDTYRQRLARLLKVDERSLQGRLPARTRRGRSTPVQPRRTSATPVQVLRGTSFQSIRLQEEHCLGVLLRKPEFVYRLDRVLQKTGLTRLAVQDFQDTEHQLLMRLIQEALAQEFSHPLNVIIGSVPMSLMEAVDRMLAETENLTLSEERLLENLFQTVVRLRIQNLHQAIDHLRFLIAESQEDSSQAVREYMQTMTQYALMKSKLDQALAHIKDRSVLTE